MDGNQEIRRMCCYAAIMSGFNGSNYLTAHMRLVLALILKKKYKTIDPHVLVRDFKAENHYEISYFPMLSILDLAVKNGYLNRAKIKRPYTVTEKIEEFDGVQKEIDNQTKSYNAFANQYIKYCLENGKPIEQAQAEEIINSYVDSQKLNHFRGEITSRKDDDSLEYLFNRFICQLKEDNHPSFSFLCSMVTGSILSDCLIYNEEMSDNGQLRGLTVILDTAIMLIALDVDPANRGAFYREMLKELTRKGAELGYFLHTYDEMQAILQGAADRIGSPDYDPALASDTLAYFHSKNASREDIERFSNDLKNLLEGLNIKPKDVYPGELGQQYHQNVELLHSMIEEQYKKKNKSIDLEEKWQSIRYDAQSILYTYIRRAGSRPIKINDASYIFITKNDTLSQVSFDFHINKKRGGKTLPPVLTDVFIGTYVWLENPVKIEEMNSRLIYAQSYLAFQPNDELLRKLSEALNKMEKEGIITPEVCYALKGSTLVSEKLSKKTLGDPAAFTFNTANEIVREMMLEEREAGRVEEREKAEKEIAEIREKEQNEKKQAIMLKKETEQKLLENLKNQLSDKEKLLNILKQNEKIALRAKSKRRNWFIFWAIIILVCFILLAIFTSKWGCSTIFSFVLGCIPVVVGLIAFIISLIDGKEGHLIDYIFNFIQKKYMEKCEELGCTKEAIEKAEMEIEIIKAQIEQYSAE